LLYSLGMFRTLEPAKILATIRLFRHRIDRAFPQSGLSAVAGELEDTAHVCFKEMARQQEAHWGLRIAVGAGVGLILCLPLEVWWLLNLPTRFSTFVEFVQATDAAFNVVVLLTGAVLFLVSMENRMKRNSALKVLHELRSLAHVVDMHQLSKDPVMDMGGLDDGVRLSEDRPKAIQNAEHLWQYLSLSTDLLAVVGKLAACIAQSQTDRTVLDTVYEIEMISTSLSRKIWQKMGLVKPPGPVGMRGTSQAQLPPSPVANTVPPAG
jgi:hypothetical protein